MTRALGRIVNHDPRSRAFTAPLATALKSVSHRAPGTMFHGPVLDQLDVGACHDAETEILTRSGWLPFPELTMDSELATVDPATSALTYEKPTRVIQLPYCGDVHVVQNQRHDFKVTPDHTMLVRKWDERARTLAGNYSMVPMKDIGWYAGLMTSVAFAGNVTHNGTYTIPGIPDTRRHASKVDLVVPMKAWLGFLGIYLAEGTMLKPRQRDPYKFQIAAFKVREKTYCKRIFAELGITALELKDRFTFRSARIYAHMEALGLKGVYAAEKFVPAFVFDLPAEDIDALLEGHREGDGSVQNGRWTHHTSSPQLADDLQRLMFLAGRSTGRSSRPPRLSTIHGRTVTGRHAELTVRQHTGIRSSVERKSDVRVEHYEGTVYCAEVPTHHTLVTRRNGKILIAGNCTGFALSHALNTSPLKRRGQLLNDDDALALYSRATELDPFPGSWPPDDTGSSSLAVCKAAKEAGYISSYRHAFGIDQALAALVLQPLIAGLPWLDTMWYPDDRGYLDCTGNVVGGHEISLIGLSVKHERVTVLNNWSSAWGRNGRAYLRFTDLDALLRQQGDVTVPIR